MKNKAPFKVIVVGLGNIGLGYDLKGSDDQIFTHTKACLAHDSFDLIAGIDPNIERRMEFETFTGKKAYNSLVNREIQPGEADMVIISTPSRIRSEVVKEALKLEPIVLLIEKPLALTLDEATRIVELCKREKIFLAINYFRYYNPKIQSVMTFVKQKKFGSFIGAVCYYSDGVLNNASHYISLLLQWLGIPTATGLLGMATALLLYDVDASFYLDFDGPIANFFPIQAEYSIAELDLLFERGRVRFENFCEDVILYDSKSDPFFAGYRRTSIMENQPDRPGLLRYQYFVLDALEKVLCGEGQTTSNADNALETMKICEKVINEAESTPCIP